MLKITNTLTGKKELFTPLEGNNVRLYVCGITPYDYAHVGHGRVYVIFDVLYRLLNFLNYNVKYCRNFTDIDDKLLSKAVKETGNEQDYKDVAQRYITTFTHDMAQLNCTVPTYEPRVTDSIPAIIKFIKGLVDNGTAYVVDGDVYFHIPAFPAYGMLSKQKLDELVVGARVEANDKKKNPLDFALWKSEEEGQFWQSPWGWGRPGWHIECSALAAHYLGKHIDIHAGGMDLIFTHHENEIAQSEGLFGAPFARYWMHNAFVRINKEKMSKSLGNFFTLRDVFTKFDPMVVRFYYLNHYYRSPLDFSFDDIEAVQKSYQKLCRVLQEYTAQDVDAATVHESVIVKKMLVFLCDDLNTPGMLGVVFENLGELQRTAHEACSVKAFLQNVLGLSLQPLPVEEAIVTPEIKQLLAERETARVAKDWTRADVIRDQLKALGFEVQDKKK
ncbi:MAG: cysteine--tRNA ligase [Candidatus Dependentiae bacterium]|nr:cysteine--tRNA ligase [Candidatus Dependentiae bacterium]